MTTSPAAPSRSPVPGPTTGAALDGDVVRVELAALPSHVRTARLICAAVARRVGLDPGLLDELKLAVGEACTRAVELHAAVAPQEPVEVCLGLSRGTLSVEVSDRGPASEAPGDVPGGSELLDQLSSTDGGASELGLALVRGLVEDLRVTPRDGGGTTVRMRWPVAG